jgi:hypothetical protein
MEYEKLMKGLKLIRISILITMVNLLVGGMRNFLFTRAIRSGMIFEYTILIFRIYEIFVYIGLGLSAIVLIISGIGLFNINKDSEKIGRDHKKDMRWAIRFYWISFAVVIWTWIRVFYHFLPFDNLFYDIVIYPTIFEMLSWVSLISMILHQVLPLRNIAGKDQRRLVSIYAVGRIIIPVFWQVLFIFIMITQIYIVGLVFFNEFFTLFISFLTVFFYFLLLRAYHETIKRIGGEEVKSFNRRLRFRVPFSSGFEKGLAKPRTYLVAFIIVGLVIGTTTGIIDLRRYNEIFGERRGGGGDVVIIQPDPETYVDTISATGQLDEGSSYDYPFEMENVDIISIEVTLTWTDENVRAPLQNEPDTFSLTLYVDETEIHSETGSNERISFTAHGGEGDRFGSGSFTVQVELENAGEIYGPAGVIVRAQDNGNDYDLQIVVEYYSELEETSQQH